MKMIKATIYSGTEAQFPDGFAPNSNGWTGVVKYGPREFTTPFFTGSLVGVPRVSSVLDCLQLDSTGLDDGFTNWAEDFGFDADSRKAEALYKRCVKQRDDLREPFGDDFEEFMGLDDEALEALCVEVE